MMAKEVKETSKDETKKPLTWKENLIAQVKEFVIVFGGFILLNNFVIASFLVPTGSMENEVLTGDFLMVNKFLYGPSTPRNIMFTDIRLPWTTLPGFKDVERGDVIVFEFPGMRDEVKPEAFTFYLKRCMAVAGDTLEVRNRVVYVNGQMNPIPKNIKFDFQHIMPPAFADDEIFPPAAPFNRDNYGPIVVPQKRDDHYRHPRKFPPLEHLHPAGWTHTGIEGRRNDHDRWKNNEQLCRGKRLRLRYG
jgi:signal peptidase I